MVAIANPVTNRTTACCIHLKPIASLHVGLSMEDHAVEHTVFLQTVWRGELPPDIGTQLVKLFEKVYTTVLILNKQHHQ